MSGIFDGVEPKVLKAAILIADSGTLERKDGVMDVMLHGYCDASATEVEQAVVLVQLHEDSEPLLFCGHHWDHEHGEAVLAADPFLVVDTRV
jgi:hypothetical protein